MDSKVVVANISALLWPFGKFILYRYQDEKRVPVNLSRFDSGIYIL